MDVQYYPVKDENLMPFIDYYYTLKSSESNFHINYSAFPHLNTPLCFLKNSDVEFTDYKTAYRAINKKNIMVIAWGMFVHPMEIDITGPVDKVCIVFKPLGLNYFIRNAFSKAVDKNCGQFTSWRGSEFDTLLPEIFATEYNETRIKLIEEFLITQIRKIDKGEFLHNVVSLLTNIEQDLSIEDICKITHVTPRTLTRVCQNHLGASPIEFKKIARFRHSLKSASKPQGIKINFLQLGLDSNFYDQSHLIKAYRQLTGNSPSSFFKSIEIKANDNFILQVLK